MNQHTSFYRKFVGTAGLMFTGRGLSTILGVIYARYLGPEEFGLYSFTIAIIVMATLPVIAGLPNLIIREVAHFHLDDKWEYLTGIINWSRLYVLVISIFIIACMHFALYLDFFDDSVSGVLCYAVLLIPLRGLLTQQGAVLNGFKKPIQAQLPVQIFMPVITLTLLLAGLLFGVELTSGKLVNISILASLSAFFFSALLLRWTLKPTIKKSQPRYNIKSWHASLLPFTMMAFISTLNTELASVLLGFLVDHKSVAYFKVAMQAVALISLALTSINTVIMPNIAGLYKQGDLQATQALLTKSVRLSALVSLPVICFLIVFGESLISLLFGSEYLRAYLILVILCAGQLVNVLMGAVGLVLNMTGNERSALKSLFITLLLNILLLSILIPTLGVIGAAISVSVSLVCWNFLMAVDVYRLTKLQTWISIRT